MRYAHFRQGALALLVCFGVGAAASAATPGDMAFDVHITLSKQAAATLVRRKEAMAASASFYGDPKPAAEKHADEVGRIDLGTEDVEIPGVPGQMHFTGAKVATERLGWLAGPVQVNVNVYSARKSSPDNLLQCDFIDGTLDRVRQAPITLHCSLIEENVDTSVKP